MSERVYFSPDELVARWRGVYTRKTLANWRSTGGGPEYRKIKGRVLYPAAGVYLFERRKGIESMEGGGNG